MVMVMVMVMVRARAKARVRGAEVTGSRQSVGDRYLAGCVFLALELAKVGLATWWVSE